MRTIDTIRAGLYGVLHAVVDAEYRALCQEIRACPECAPYAPHFCDEHDGLLKQHFEENVGDSA